MKRRILTGILAVVLMLSLSGGAFAAHTHEYQAEVRLPTCTESGYVMYVCSCGDSYIGKEYPAIGHDWDSGVVTKAATCTVNGVKTYTCNRCKSTQTESIASTGHVWDSGKVTKEATCAENGVRTYTCTVCGATRTESIATVSHKWNAGIVTTEPSYSEAGERTYTCTVCGSKRTEVIPATGEHTDSEHTWNAGTVTKAPTCTEAGERTYTCTVCGEKKTESVAALGHSWGTGAVTKAPTAVEKGERTYTCTVCGEKKTEEIPATGEHSATNHIWDAGTVTKEPTCAEAGERTYACLVCGEKKTESIAATGKHNYQKGVCTVCGAKEACPSAVFQDVTRHGDVEAAGYYYHDAIDWAVSKGVTNGTSATTFSPNAGCTRAQAVTFLWRAAGSPEPETAGNPFSDVSSTAYYYKAVLWASENGITNGTGGGKYSPEQTCTRAQIVTFLWRAMQEPAPATSANPFRDVPGSAYYCAATLWASENGIALGTGSGNFSPNLTCTRAQIVTFFYRTALKFSAD